MKQRKIKKLVLLLAFSISPLLIYASGIFWKCDKINTPINSGIFGPSYCYGVPSCVSTISFHNCHTNTNTVEITCHPLDDNNKPVLEIKFTKTYRTCSD